MGKENETKKEGKKATHARIFVYTQKGRSKNQQRNEFQAKDYELDFKKRFLCVRAREFPFFLLSTPPST